VPENRRTKMPSHYKFERPLEATPIECPNCDEGDVRTVNETQTFTYGKDREAVELTASVPVHTCVRCGFQFTDSRAEDARHNAICRHLGVLTPKEIVALRKQYGMTRAEFAEVTRIGEASLARWESGQIIQNGANDQLLYLLCNSANMEMLALRVKGPEYEWSALSIAVENRFPALTDIQSQIHQAAMFRLCPTSRTLS